MTGDKKSFDTVRFKLDSGSDFTTLSCDDLDNLGYSDECLQSCKIHGKAYTATSGEVVLQYIENVSIKFGDRELQGCRIFFALGSGMRSLFGSDILKYFNREIDYDKGELRLKRTANPPKLVQDETPIQIYSVSGK
ncbi:MAG: retroviral-like aspartic protease family protein [Oscillospiraceae bacterium]|nr:retroviral-like aspartic protease family protein [Oscillospiraceae bacterium]